MLARVPSTVARSPILPLDGVAFGTARVVVDSGRSVASVECHGKAFVIAMLRRSSS
jgi:hypothetical protein